MGDGERTTNNYRSAILTEPSLMPPNGPSDHILRTPYAGNVRALPPPLPQPPIMQNQYQTSAYGNNYGYSNGFGNSYGSGLFGGYGGGGFGSMYGSYGSGYGGYGSYGAYNRFGMGNSMNPMDPETRFIQMAEASSRPAFESIESLVSAIGNIASMLDSTFFALTSSFRAILGVAANFGRLRGVFAQFWQTFAIFRGLQWIYRKILYWLRISNLDPSTQAFKNAFNEALQENSTPNEIIKPNKRRQSPWPVLAFLSFIFTAPYLIMKLLNTVTNTAQEEARNPAKWVKPIETVALYDFQARNSAELSIQAGERVLIAPKEIQNTNGLLNTGWGLATKDGITSGMVPINYVKSPNQIRQEQQQSRDITNKMLPQESMASQQPPQPQLMDLSTSAFAAPPSVVPNFEIAPQPIGPPTISDIVNNTI